MNSPTLSSCRNAVALLSGLAVLALPAALSVGCLGNTPEELCDASVDECTMDADCGSGASCEAQTCSCVGGAAPVIPANTTGCTVDTSGCLVGDGSTCVTELDAPITGEKVTVQVDGTLLDSQAPREIGIWGFALSTGYEPAGYQAKMGGGVSQGSYGVLIGNNGVGNGNLEWPYKAGEVPMSGTATFDKTATSATLKVRSEGAPTTPISGSSMGSAESDKVIITLWHAKACNIVVTQP